MGLHVSISAEPIAQIANFSVTNSMLTGIIVSFLLILFALFSYFHPKKLKPTSRFQSLIELIIESIYNLNRDIAGEKKARIFFPLIAPSLIYILFNNWIGLLPGVGTIGLTHEIKIGGKDKTVFVASAEAANHDESVLPSETGDHDQGEISSDSESMKEAGQETKQEHSEFIPLFRSATADLNTTLALALISVFMTQYYGVKYLGLSYFTKFLNFKQGPIFTFVGFLEIISEIAKIISFAFRLFGNIFAGEVLLAVIASLLPIIGPIPFLGLEIFVGFIQSLVFAMLTLVFINMATMSHEDHA